MFPLAVLERALTHDHFASTANTSTDFAFISFSADSFAAFLALMTFFFASISLFRDLSSSCFAFMDKDRAKEIIHRFGAEKVLFGTDYPMWSYKSELEYFLSLSPTNPDKLTFVMPESANA